MNTGWEIRLPILLREAEMRFAMPLRAHGWEVEVENGPDGSDYVFIAASRAGKSHKVALVYSGWTANDVYKNLARESEHIFYQGIEQYDVSGYTYGVDKPVSQATAFLPVLFKWNEEVATGKFAPSSLSVEPSEDRRREYRLLLSEDPIGSVWLRIRQLQSIRLAERLVSERSRYEGGGLTGGDINAKAQGVAFSLRNAADYFDANHAASSVSQRVLNLYYGSLSFAFAEILASPEGPSTLAEIEAFTKQGHGLYTFDLPGSELGDLIVGVLASGFFYRWMAFAKVPTDGVPSKNPRTESDLRALPVDSWLCVEDLFGSIPELAELFEEVFEGKPRWVQPTLDKDSQWTIPMTGFARTGQTRTYSIFIDGSGRLDANDIASFPGPITQIEEMASPDQSRRFRAAVDHVGKNIGGKHSHRTRARTFAAP